MAADMSKAPIEGKRPGDAFRRGGDDYRVIGTYVNATGERNVVTESVHGRERWF